MAVWSGYKEWQEGESGGPGENRAICGSSQRRKGLEEQLERGQGLWWAGLPWKSHPPCLHHLTQSCVPGKGSCNPDIDKS